MPYLQTHQPHFLINRTKNTITTLAIMSKTSKLVEIVTSVGRRRSLLARANSYRKSDEKFTEKGYFVVYTSDGKRFMVPLAYVNSSIFIELFRMSEDEFGLPGDRPIRMPFSAEFMEYVLCLLQRRITKDVERALLTSISTLDCSAANSIFTDRDNRSFVACSSQALF